MYAKNPKHHSHYDGDYCRCLRSENYNNDRRSIMRHCYHRKIRRSESYCSRSRSRSLKYDRLNRRTRAREDSGHRGHTRETCRDERYRSRRGSRSPKDRNHDRRIRATECSGQRRHHRGSRRSESNRSSSGRRSLKYDSRNRRTRAREDIGHGGHTRQKCRDERYRSRRGSRSPKDRSHDRRTRATECSGQRRHHRGSRRSESKDRSHDQRTRATECSGQRRHHRGSRRSESNRSSSGRRSLKYDRLNRRTRAREGSGRNRHHRESRRSESDHSRRYGRYYRSAERSRRYRDRHYYRCSSSSLSSTEKSGYSEKCLTNRDGYRSIYDRQGIGGYDHYYSGVKDMKSVKDDFVNADEDEVLHLSPLAKRVTKEVAKRSPQEHCEQMAVIKEMVAVPASTIKNNNPDWHSLDDKIDCKICKIEFTNRSDVVRHYINSHPNNEVILSRVAPDVAELLRDPKAVHDSKRIVQQRCAIYKQKCYFCNTSVSKDKRDWITHIARHTGYYRDKCTRCFKKFIRHRNPYCVDHGYVVREQSQRQFERQFKNDDVFAYVCGLCNYVRFDKAEIKKHLNSQHDGDAENDFKEVIFLRFPKATNQHETVAIKLNESQPNNQEDDHFEGMKAIIKNNNPDWHCLSSDKRCKICSCNIKHSSVYHYVNAHPNSEVIPSRVPPDVGRFLRSLAYTAKCEISGKRHNHFMYEQFCYFCNKLKCCKKSHWINHIIRHTGYYKYQCVVCSEKMIMPSGHACGGNRNMIILQQPRFDEEIVMAYLCDVCNFVRFSKAEIETHLHSQHDGNDADSFKEIVFLSFPAGKRNDCKYKQENVKDETNAESAIEGTNSGSFTPPKEPERVFAEAPKVTPADIVRQKPEQLSSTVDTSLQKLMENWNNDDANGWETCSSDLNFPSR